MVYGVLYKIFSVVYCATTYQMYITIFHTRKRSENCHSVIQPQFCHYILGNADSSDWQTDQMAVTNNCIINYASVGTEVFVFAEDKFPFLI